MRKKTPNQADNIMIFWSWLLPKMKLSLVLEARYIGRKAIDFRKFFHIYCAITFAHTCTQFALKFVKCDSLSFIGNKV